MDVLESEGIIPVIIGNADDAVFIAKKIYRLSGHKAHIFSDRFTLLQKLKYKCHRVSLLNERVIECCLIDFAVYQEEFNTPALIPCDERAIAFTAKYREELEPYYIIVDIKRHDF